MGEWRYSSTVLDLDTGRFTPEERAPPIPIGYEAGWAS
jgi:hypothetical protein